MLVVKYRNIFFALSGVIVAIAIGAIALFGLKFGIEFIHLLKIRYVKMGLTCSINFILNTCFAKDAHLIDL